MATVATKKKDKEKEKLEQRKRTDEVKSIAMRQGYITEDQILYLLADDEQQAEVMDDVLEMLGKLKIEVFGSEEEAQERAKKLAEEAKLKATMEEELAVAEGFRISDLELSDAKKKLEGAEDRLKRLRDERSAALAKKRQLDEANDKTLQTEAEIARLEEELARLKGEEASGARKPAEAAPAPATTVVKPSN